MKHLFPYIQGASLANTPFARSASAQSVLDSGSTGCKPIAAGGHISVHIEAPA